MRSARRDENYYRQVVDAFKTVSGQKKSTVGFILFYSLIFIPLCSLTAEMIITVQPTQRSISLLSTKLGRLTAANRALRSAFTANIQKLGTRGK